MLILTNCLTETPDEGCLKVVNSLVKRIKAARPDVKVISYERRSGLTDVFWELNKLLLNVRLITTLWKEKDPLLYLPFPARKTAMALRVFLLSLWTRRRLQILLVLKTEIGRLGRFLLRCSGVQILVLSAEAAEFYGDIVGDARVRYIKTGVDTNRFTAATDQRMQMLKQKYGLDLQKKVILHVGHLKDGRNVSQLLKIDPGFQVVLVTSTLTRGEQDAQLEAELRSKANIRLIMEYIPEIQEIYQLCDVYFFPVVQEGNCIDVPLSCLEAAACNKPVVTTEYGEMSRFHGKPGFFYMKDMEAESINRLISQALCCADPDTRSVVLEYDWSNAVNMLLQQ